MMRRKQTWCALLTAALVAFGCDPEDGVDPRDLVVDEPGGASSDDGGEDQWQEEFEEGAPQVCEPVPVPVDVQFAARDPADQLAAPAPDPLAASLNCPLQGAGTSTYVDWRCTYNAYDGTANLYCKYWCDCDVTYSSPCPAAVPDCGSPFHQAATQDQLIGTAPLGMWQCNMWGPVHCRLNTKTAASGCTSWCKAVAPTRTRDCPDCPK